MRTYFAPLPLLAALLCVALPSARALTLTFSNENAAANAIHGIADQDAQRITSATVAGGVIGTMKTLTDAQIDAAVAVGDLAALDADFQVFDAVSGPFSLAAFGVSGAVEAALTEDTSPTAPDSLAGRPIYVWLYKGSSRATATQYFLAKLDAVFASDPGDDVPLSGITLRLNPDTISRYYSGTSGSQTHDYGLGGGAAPLFRMQGLGSPNQPPVAHAQTRRAQPGVLLSGTVTGTDADEDTLTFSLETLPTKGLLNFNGASGAFTYLAAADAEGQDSFTFTASDGTASSEPATVTINIGDHGLLPQTITFEQPAQRTINTAPFAITATASSGLPVSFQILSGHATLSGNTITLTRKVVGIIVVRATQAGDDTYAAAPPVVRSIFITAAATTPTLGHLIQTYQGIGLAPTLAGAPVGSTVTMEFKSGTAPFTTTLPVNAGSYQVRATVVPPTGPSLVRTGTFTIQKAVLTARADDQQRLIGQPNPQLTATYTGFQGADDFDTVFPSPATPTARVPNATTSARLNSPGGSYPITLSGGAAVNYTLRFVPGRLTVRSFAGDYEALPPNPGLTAPGAKVDVTIAGAVRLGLSGQPNTMTCTAKLWLPTESAFIPMTGILAIDPLSTPERLTGRCTLSRRLGTTTTSYQIDLNISADGAMSTVVSVNDVIVASGTEGYKIHVPALSPVISYAGDHTAILAAPQPLASTPNPLPGGSGHATAKIANNAVMTFAGKLGDGTSFTSSLKPTINPAETTVNYRLFIYPYAGRKDSSVSGWLNLSEHPSLTGRRCILESDGLKIYWAKQARSTDASYPLGIAASSCGLMLDPWRAPSPATRTTAAVTLLTRLGLAASGQFNVTHDSFTSPSYDDLPTGLQLLVTPTNRVLVTTPQANLTGWKITSLNATTGVFTGEFTLKKETPRQRRVTFSGVLRQSSSGLGSGGVVGAAMFILPGATTTEKATTGTLTFTRPSL